MNEEVSKLGPCCGCETEAGVRNILMLEKKCLVPGHGWGCLCCNLPPDGAHMVLCDNCLDRLQNNTIVIKYACRGYPGIDGRCLLDELKEPFKHDMTVPHYPTGVID